MKNEARIIRLICLVLMLISVLGLQIGHAQEFPTKPITLIVPTAPGGSHDLTARAVASVAAHHLGQPVIVQLKPGGGGAIGSDFVANAEPDGYTLLFGGPTWNTTPPAVEGRSKGPDDLIAVCRINYNPTVIGVRANAPFKTFKEMIEWCKANPGKLMVATLGLWSGTDFFWKQVNKLTGITVRAVPYEGGGAAMTAVIGGHADTTNGMTTVFLPYVKAEKMRIVAVTDNHRDKVIPDVPTVKEGGIDITYIMWRGVLAPKGTPRPIVDKLTAGFKKISEDPAFVSMIQKMGDDVQYLGPDEFTKVWRGDYEAQKEVGKMFRNK